MCVTRKVQLLGLLPLHFLRPLSLSVQLTRHALLGLPLHPLGSQLTLGEGLVLGGDLAYSNDEINGSSAAAGVLNFRFNF